MTEGETILERLKDHEIADKTSFGGISDKLDLIIAQTTQHNHRLTKAEKYIYTISGGLIVVAVIVVPLFLQLFR